MRRLAIVLALVFALVACGGSSKPKSSDDQAQITSTYEKFFSGKTSLSDREALLENGPKFKSVIQSFASNPLAKNVSAKVASVTLHGANKARVDFTIRLGGTSLPTQVGTAVRQNGTWKVGAASLCKLVALGGTTPSACKS